MTKRTGHYVTAIIDGGTANQRIKWLVGPFVGPRAPLAALAMMEPTRRAAMRTNDPLYAIAAFSTDKITVHKLRPGSLDLSLIDLDDLVKLSVNR